MALTNKYCVSTQIKTKLLLPLGSGQSLGYCSLIQTILKKDVAIESCRTEFRDRVIGLIGAHTK
jgi:hypothetical protein